MILRPSSVPSRRRHIYNWDALSHIMKKCPKCGKENDDDAIFCDACDWKLNMRYAENGEAKYLINSRMFAIGSLVLGIISVVLLPFAFYIGSAIFGAIGMFLGGYTQSFVRVTGVKDEKKKVFMGIAIVGLAVSVIGFMFGFAHLF